MFNRMNKIIISFISLTLLGGVYFLNQQSSPSTEHKINVNSALTVSRSDNTKNILGELKYLFSIPNQYERETQLRLFFLSRLKENPDELMILINGISNLDQKQASYTIALSEWHKIDSSALKQWLLAQPMDQYRDEALISLANNSLPVFEEALFYSDKISNFELKTQWLESYFNQWLIRSPKQAIVWAINKSVTVPEWLLNGFKQLSLNDTKQAIDLLSFLASIDSLLLDKIIHAVAFFLPADSIDDELILLIQTLSPYEIREKFITQLIPALFEQQWGSLEQLEALISSLLPSDTKNELQQLLAMNWVEKEPAEAALYAENLSGEAREQAVEMVVRSWLKSDLHSADEWLETLGGNINQAANTLARGSARLGNIEIADKWLDKIEEEELKTEAIYDVIYEWHLMDPKTGLHQLVFQENLSTSQKLDILHTWYPERVFLSPEMALIELNKEGI